MDKKQKARKNLLRKGKDAGGISIEGYDFNLGVDYKRILASYKSMGFQASNFARAVEIVNEMIKNGAFIFLGYTSNIVSSGLRENIRWLVEHKKVNALVTTCGGIEEDIIKCFGDFVLGDTEDSKAVSVPDNQKEQQWLSGFKADGSELRKKGINRIGNIFVSNNLYIKFESFVQPILLDLYNKNKVISASELVWRLGERINDKRSICYWAWRNKIPVFCPAITDGALGDNIYFFKFKKNDFIVDVAEDAKKLNDLTIGLRKCGVIILGAGVVKHAILNACMLRNGAEYAVYINTEQEYDGSDSGAMPEEAVSWGKILPKKKSKYVKVFADATLVFPLLVAESFAKKDFN